jgi:hypothetical protein
VSDVRNHDVADIRAELWLLLAGLKEGEVDADVADSMIEALDSLIDLIRLEGELKPSVAELDEAGKKEAERTT